MTSMRGPQGSDGGGLDLLAINRDADLLDLLARRAPVPAGDPVLAMLAALAADVDEGLDDLLVATEDDPLSRAASAATVVPGRPAVRRGHGLRLTTVAIVVGATLSIGGVAAAVTGDPLAPVKGIVTAMGGNGADHHPGKARAFGAGKQAKAQLRNGDVAGAQASLAAMKAELLRDDLSHGDRQSIEARIAALQKQVDHAVAVAAGEQGRSAADSNGDGNGTGQGDGKVDGSNGKPTGKGGGTATDGRPTSKPQPTKTSEPNAGNQGGTGDGKKAAPSSDASSGSTSHQDKPSRAAGSGNRPRESSPSSSDAEDAPTSATATDDPGTSSGGSGSHAGGTAATTGAASGR
jgi:hypothetical protein